MAIPFCRSGPCGPATSTTRPAQPQSATCRCCPRRRWSRAHSWQLRPYSPIHSHPSSSSPLVLCFPHVSETRLATHVVGGEHHPGGREPEPGTGNSPKTKLRVFTKLIYLLIWYFRLILNSIKNTFAYSSTLPSPNIALIRTCLRGIQLWVWCWGTVALAVSAEIPNPFLPSADPNADLDPDHPPLITWFRMVVFPLLSSPSIKISTYLGDQSSSNWRRRTLAIHSFILFFCLFSRSIEEGAQSLEQTHAMNPVDQKGVKYAKFFKNIFWWKLDKREEGERDVLKKKNKGICCGCHGDTTRDIHIK